MDPMKNRDRRMYLKWGVEPSYKLLPKLRAAMRFDRVILDSPPVKRFFMTRDRILADDPGYLPSWNALGITLQVQGLLEEAVQCYRRPVFSGILTGLAIGAIYYPVFLLPFWFAFYWRRGLFRFGFGLAATLAALFEVDTNYLRWLEWKG